MNQIDVNPQMKCINLHKTCHFSTHPFIISQAEKGGGDLGGARGARGACPEFQQGAVPSRIEGARHCLSWALCEQGSWIRNSLGLMGWQPKSWDYPQ